MAMLDEYVEEEPENAKDEEGSQAKNEATRKGHFIGLLQAHFHALCSSLLESCT